MQSNLCHKPVLSNKTQPADLLLPTTFVSSSIGAVSAGFFHYHFTEKLYCSLETTRLGNFS